MRLNQKLVGLLCVGVTTTLVSIGCRAGVSATDATIAPVAQAQSARSSGTFVAAEKPTTGMARIVEENGHRFLELNSAFSTSDQGPDLHVLLDTTGKPPQSYDAANSGRYVNLGKLSKYKGAQRYPIPDVINVSRYQSVVIWCRMANATFGYAPLGGASNATAPK
jgi:hypothetical protein